MLHPAEPPPTAAEGRRVEPSWLRGGLVGIGMILASTLGLALLSLVIAFLLSLVFSQA